jgi:hypothetical protein
MVAQEKQKRLKPRKIVVQAAAVKKQLKNKLIA